MKTCLVVDDSRVIRTVARKIVEELGFSVVEAEDGKVALAKSEESLPDVVLLDWNMPNMDGLEYMKALRDLPGAGEVRVVFCTTENDMRHIQEALEAGADEYIMKPFDAEIVKTKFDLLGLMG
jgi:two-component system chemotaxis response regulator CheY